VGSDFTGGRIYYIGLFGREKELEPCTKLETHFRYFQSEIKIHFSIVELLE